jgi:DNA-binding NtrC family response regulator
MARILIVDDQRHVGKWISKALTNDGYRISAIGDAASALECIRKQPPELVLLGSLSERIDSLELLVDIKREHPKIPVLAYAIKSFDATDRLREVITGLLGENRLPDPDKKFGSV